MSILSFCAGAFGWSASEYLIHRFIGHGPKLRRATTLLGRLSPSGLAAEFNAEHLAHHTDPTYFAPTSRKILAASAAVPAMALALAPILGARRSAAFTLGFGITYGAYEVLHRRIHTHPPRGPYGRWLRRHHLLHHHRTPRDNHGVTTPLWDHVVGTHRAPERLRVPQHVAPKWMVDERTGLVREEFGEDYEVWVQRKVRRGGEARREAAAVVVEA